jgi:V/A-type H+/Na+-transporting ATPase subunit D
MPKLKLTKNELKKQKEQLRMFTRYLPTLQLKKQQLQMEIGKIVREIAELSEDIEKQLNQINQWVAVFGEDIGIDLESLIQPQNIITTDGNIAGIDIPVFKEVVFNEPEYDLLRTPLWLDAAIDICRQIISLRAQLIVFEKQQDVLKEELRITNQRVNLFEKVKIPETKENIRVIRIVLGDLQTAEVVRGKIAKTKLEKKYARQA